MEAAENPIIIDEKLPSDSSALRKLDTYWDEVEQLPVPDTIPSINLNEFSEIHRTEMFDLAKNGWEESYDPALLISTLRSNQTSTGERKELKDLRKHGLVLRAAYRSLDGRHLAPRNHWLFLKLLGELNDGYYSPQRQESKERLAEFIEKNYMSLNELDFFPATDKSFQDNYRKDLAVVEDFNNKDVLSARDFHSMRKLLRNTMNMFRLSGTLTHDPLMTQRARYMQDLNDTLGNKQDQLVQQDIAGELAYGDAVVAIPSLEKARIQGFVQANKNG